MKALILGFILANSDFAMAETKSNKQLWIEAHNEARQEYGVAPLVWSPKLKRQAKRWALELTKDCEKLILKHSPNRGDVGENLAGSYGRKHPVNLPVEWWVKEKRWYDVEKNECNVPEGVKGSCGHFTQVISKRSKTFGCAVSVCPGPGNKTIYVCNYAPHGNMRGYPPLKTTWPGEK